MRFKWWATILTSILIIHLASTANANDNNLNEQYQKFNQQLGTNPQQVLTDLLLIPTPPSDSLTKAQHHYTLSLTYLTLAYPKKSLDQANLALKALAEHKADWLYHSIMVVKTQAMELSGQAQEALPLIQHTVQWARTNNNNELLVDALVGLGYIENTLRRSVKALDAFMQAYELAPEKDAIVTKSALASSIALVYEYRKENELAIPYFEESVTYHRANENYLELSISLYGLGRANKNIGNSELGNKQLQESLDISRAIGDDQGVAYALKELAPIYIENDQAHRAESMLTEAAELFELSQNKLMLLDVYKSLAVLHLQNNDYTEAQDYLTLAKGYLNQERMPMQNITLTEIEARLLASQGNHQLAFEQLIKTIAKKQQLQSAQSTRQLHELRSQFELESKEKENLLLSKVNQEQKFNLLQQNQKNQLLIIGISTTSVIILLLALLIYRSRIQKKVLFKLANFDAMTSLANRSHSMHLLSHAHSNLAPGQSLYICMLDLDNFKQINDHFGHDMGDKVLQKFGAICRENFLDQDIYGRFGGEEFIAGMIRKNQNQVKVMIDQLRSIFTETAEKMDLNPVTTGFSAGISICQLNDSLKEKIQTADLAMYQAKNTGRNKTIFTD
ncbi:MAG: diguanylate cyclase [Marinicella sp.]